MIGRVAPHQKHNIFLPPNDIFLVRSLANDIVLLLQTVLVLLLCCCLARRARQRKRADTPLVSSLSPNHKSLTEESASPLAVRVRVDADHGAETPPAVNTLPTSAHGTVYEAQSRAQYADLGRLSGHAPSTAPSI